MRMRGLLILALALLAANVGWWLLRGHDGPMWQRTPTPVVSADEPAQAATGPSDAHDAGSPGASSPDTLSGPPTTGAPPPQAAIDATTGSRAPSTIGTGSVPPSQAALPSGLLVPVQGIRAADLRDTFGDPRSGERMHEALDIMAPAGTPVLAAADGHVEKLFTSERGGLTIYQFEPSGRWCYYYAHLQSYAPGLAEGRQLKRGEVIGYVGSTGNADPAAPHLHFAVFALTPEKQWWTGTALNPYPMLARADAR